MISQNKFSVFLIVSIVFGVLLGLFLGQSADILKPLGDLLLNLLFTAVVPLVFFSISSAVCEMKDLKEFGCISGAMILVFVVTGVIASFVMVLGVLLFPPLVGAGVSLPKSAAVPNTHFLSGAVSALSVSDFPLLFSKNNMLALIVFALFIGLGTAGAGERGKPFSHFLFSGNEVMMKLISYVMLYAPVGLSAYFAYLVGVFGPKLLGPYLRAVVLYYPIAFLYFFMAFSGYAYFAGGKHGFKIFWANIFQTAVTAFGTGSSVAAIPSNLKAADRIGVPRKISELVIPLGATIHMDGSCLSAILKIALLYHFYGMPFLGAQTILTAVAIAILASVVMSGIPGGGFAGEVMIVSFYQFPPEALVMITMIGMLVDQPATLVNSVGDNVASMMVARIVSGKSWMKDAARKPKN